MTIVETRLITGGVDTHLDTHVAAALDGNGGVLGVESFPTTTAGFAELHVWLASFGTLDRVGVEGTGAYGAGLARFLRGGRGGDRGRASEPSGPPRPRQVRQHRCRRGRRAALSGRAKAVAKTADGNVEAIRVLLVAYRSGRDTRIKCLDQLRHLGFCAPDELRERFRGVPVGLLAETAATLRPNRNGDPVVYATKLAMHTLGRRVVDIDADCARLHSELASLVKATAPSLVALHGVGIHTAALLLVAAGDNAERITSEAAFAHLCGVAPIHASSGKVTRHRLNRGGNRQANHALWRIVFTRMSSDPRTPPTSNGASPKGAPNPKSCESSSATSPARSTATSPAYSATIGAAGLALEMPARHHGCPANDLPTRHSTPHRDTAWPDKSLPSHSSGPSLVCQHRRQTDP